MLILFLDESIEPPKRVQVIAGPQSNTLLVSWEQPSSSITAARGYRVFVDGRQIHDITNPSSKEAQQNYLQLYSFVFFSIIDDHTVINLNTVQQGRFLTVRTLTENDGESHDSIPIDLDEILRKVCNYLLIYF